MNYKPTIAVVCGGYSSEFEVSIKSGKNVYEAIDREKFTPYLVEIKEDDWRAVIVEKNTVPVNKADFSFTVNHKKQKIDFVYIVIHGTPGENGILQGYFDMLNIPYSTAGVDSCSLTFNKWLCNNYLKSSDIKMAKSVLVQKNTQFDEKDIVEELGLPLFVKPNSGGSSFGVTKVKDQNDLKNAIQKAWEEDSDALIEELIDGNEFTCGVICLKDKTIVLPVTEIIYENDFFDYEAKYIQSKTQEITPARISEELFHQCQDIARQVAKLTFAKGIVRVDFILQNDTFYCLEINTIPGMTAASFIPQQLKVAGLNLQTILTEIIEEALA